jgi:hypothetical protein
VPRALRRPAARIARHWIEWRRGIDAGGEHAVREAIRLVEGADPWFGFVNLMEAHVPYAPPRQHNELAGLDGLRAPAVSRKRRSYRNALAFNLGRDVFTAGELDTLRALYRGEIRYLDVILDRLLARVPAGTAVVVTADHGEALGEHHRVDHQLTMIEEVLRVPLVVLGDAPPLEVSSIRQLPELLAALAGLDPAPWRERGRVPAGVAVAEYESTVAHDRRSVGVAREGGFAAAEVGLLAAEMAAVVEGDRKLLDVAGDRTLLSLPDETPVDEPQGLDRLGRHLDAARAVRAPDPPEEGYAPQEEGEIEERLAELGYL